MGILDYITIAVYLLGMLGVGIWASRKVHNTKDFAVGGKTIGPFVIICSSVATASGASTCMGQAGIAYTDGFSALWLVIAWTIGMLFLAVFAKRMYATGANSISEIFFKIQGNAAGRMCAVFALLYCLGTLTAQMMGMGTVIELMLGDGVGYQLAVIIGGAITILYTLQGGFFAVAYTDAIQTSILGFSMLVVLPLVLFTGTAETVLAAAETVFTPGTFNLFHGVSFLSLAAVVCKYTFSACTGIPYIQRVLAARNSKEAVTNQLWAAFGFAVMGGLVMVFAVFARQLFPASDRPETVLVQIIVQHFPVFLAGLGIAGMCAAVMSTVDSYLLVISQIFSHDICGWFMKDLTEEKEFKIQKASTIVAGLFAMTVALYMTSILKVYELAASIYSSAMFFPFILSLYWKHTTPAGAISGMCAGGAVAIVLQFVPAMSFDPVIVGNLTSLVMTVLVTMATKKSELPTIKP